MPRAFLLLLPLLLAACGHTSPTPTLAPHIPPAQQASAAASMRLTFPSGTRFLLYHRASEERSALPAPDDFVYLKIELSPPDLDTLLSQPTLASPAWETTHSRIADVPGWPDWQPSTIKKFRSHQFQLPHNQCLNVLIDDDHPTIKTVYLNWFET